MKVGEKKYPCKEKKYPLKRNPERDELSFKGRREVSLKKKPGERRVFPCRSNPKRDKLSFKGRREVSLQKIIPSSFKGDFPCRRKEVSVQRKEVSLKKKPGERRVFPCRSNPKRDELSFKGRREVSLLPFSSKVPFLSFFFKKREGRESREKTGKAERAEKAGKNHSFLFLYPLKFPTKRYFFTQFLLIKKWGWRDLNPHASHLATDFKSVASTNSATSPFQFII